MPRRFGQSTSPDAALSITPQGAFLKAIDVASGTRCPRAAARGPSASQNLIATVRDFQVMPEFRDRNHSAKDRPGAGQEGHVRLGRHRFTSVTALVRFCFRPALRLRI